MTASRILLLPALALSGCVIPIPHHSVNAPRFSGRVVDATNRRPVSGADIALGGLPDTAVKSDSAGRFTTRASRTTHLLGIYTYSESLLQLPPPKSSDGKLVVTHPHYHGAAVPANCSGYPTFISGRDIEVITLPDIRLQPLP